MYEFGGPAFRGLVCYLEYLQRRLQAAVVFTRAGSRKPERDDESKAKLASRPVYEDVETRRTTTRRSPLSQSAYLSERIGWTE